MIYFGDLGLKFGKYKVWGLELIKGYMVKFKVWSLKKNFIYSVKVN